MSDLRDLIDPGWAAALAEVEPLIHHLGDMLRDELRAGNRYLPAGTDVLRAFTYPFDQVKVLLVGQDPYPTPGNAMGLSFSVPAGVALPASLRNIYREMSDDLGCEPPQSGDLRGWAEQGVCLLNRVLTVRPGQPGSHQGRGWETVTECAMRALVGRGSPLVAILWGRQARNLAPMLQGTPLIESAHPSPLSARNGFFGSKPFSRTNALLVEQGATPIDWTRTAGTQS